MELKEFDQKLRALGTEKIARPFVCNGSPLDCNVFLVGHNSATESLFENFWNPQDGGFLKKDWLKAYKEKHNFPRKTTRKRIEYLFDEFNKTEGKIKLLQTNLYCYPTGSEDELKGENKYSNVLNFLLKTVKPNVVIAHGKPASTYLCNLNGWGFCQNKWLSAEVFQFKTELYCISHLSRNRTKNECKKLACSLKEAVLERLY